MRHLWAILAGSTKALVPSFQCAAGKSIKLHQANHLPPLDRLSPCSRRVRPKCFASAACGVQALDFDQLPARALDHEAHNLVPLLDHLDVRACRRWFHHPSDLDWRVVTVRGPKLPGLNGFSAYEKGFQWGSWVAAVRLGSCAPAIGAGAASPLPSLPGFAPKERLSVIRWLASASGFSPGRGLVSA